jgi:hypothetical protein
VPQRYFKIIVLLVVLQIKTAYPQAMFKIKWISDSASTNAVKLILLDDQTFIDSTKCIQKISQVINKLAEQSYLTAGVSNIRFNDSLCLVTINPGNSYKWIKLSGGNIPEDIFTASGWRQNLFYNQIFNYQIYVQKITQIISYLEQNGYPFAQIKLDSVETLENNIKELDNSIQEDKNEIIQKKNELLFGYITSETAINIFESYKTNLNDSYELKNFFLELLISKTDNVEKQQELKDLLAEYYVTIKNIKQDVKDANIENNFQLIEDTIRNNCNLCKWDIYAS